MAAIDDGDRGAPVPMQAPMVFAVESWDPAYGVSADGTDLEQTDTAVDAGVEVGLDHWAPISPDPSASAPASVAFVDGVRRIDARVWITVDGIARLGVCATVAAGAVRTEPGRAEVVCAEVRHGLYAMAEGASSIMTSIGPYDLVPCEGESTDELYLGIHEEMTKLEREVSLSNDVAGVDLIVFDGPLRGRSAVNGVGFVKTQHVQYLEADQQRVLGRLGTGERTPLFAIGDRFQRWSWYLRLPGPINQPLSGIVRCELPAVGTAEVAAGRADQVSLALPRFASEAHKDHRAPQNLYPIAGLERELRRRLGDPALLERALRRAARR